MKTKIVTTCLILAMGFTVDALAQFTPVIAKIKMSAVAPQSDGTTQSRMTHGGIYYRSSSGDTFTTHFYVDENGNKRNSGWSTYFDATNKKIYHLDNDLQTAQVKETVTRNVVQRSHLPPDHLIVGRKVINGIDCVGVKISKGDGSQRGVNWHAPSLDLSIRTESDRGGGRKLIRELYDIQFTEPNSNVFRIPEGFLIEP